MRKADSLVWAMAALLLGTAAAKGDSFPAVSGGTWTGSAAVRFDGRDGLGSRMVHGIEWLGQPDGEGGEVTDTATWEDGWREIAMGDETTDLLSLNAPEIAVEGGRLAENTTWDNSVTHLVRHTVVVPNGKTLTMGAGAVVKIVPGATIRVEDGGRVHFAGTEGNESVVTSVEDPDFGAVVDCGIWTNREAVTGVSRQSGAATVTDANGAVRFRFNQSDLFPTVKLQNGGGKRSDGVVRIPVTVSGTARTNAFRVDWEASDGSAVFGEDYLEATGTLRWAKSDEGTKNIVIPVNEELLRGSNVSFTVRLTAHYACNAGTATAEAVIREFDFPEIQTGGWTQSASVRFDGRGGLAGSVVHGEEWIGTPDGEGGEATDSAAWEDGWREITAGEETTEILSLNTPEIAIEGGRLAGNTDWTSNVTHLVRHTVVVPNGKTLSVGPDTVVKFLPGTVIRVEDGGKLSIAGAAGHDAILTSAADDRFGVAVDCGDFLDSAVHPDNGVGGVVTQSSAASFQDNGFLQIHSFRVGAYPYVKFNDTVTFRDGGMAYVPVTIASGSRAQSFSIDWEAVDGTALFGEDYTLAGGTVTWTNTSQGTKTLQIPIATDHVVGETTSFRLRIAVCRACNASGNGECTVTIRELDKIAFEGGAWTGSDTIRFDGRESIGGKMLHGVEWLGTPDGEGGEAKDTSAWEDGWRAITAGEETTDILSLNEVDIAVEGGRLSENTTWDDSATHLVRHWVVVPNGKTLTVGAGADVKICPDAGIKVEDGGKLSLAGADGADAIVTTADDDSAGAIIPAAPEDAGLAAGAAGRIVFQSGNAAFADNGWFQVRGVGFSPANYGSVAVHNAEASRKSGVAYVAVTVGGNARNQSFAVDWEAVDGTALLGRDYKLAGGRLTWGKSSEGTKWIAIPLNTRTVAGARRSFKVRLKAVHGMAGTGKEATVEIREYEEGTALSGSAGNVVFSGESEASPPFAVDEAVWKEPMFRHDEEAIRLSGAWQGTLPAAETTVRLSWSGENGSGILAEAPGGTPAAYTWRRSDWPVGSYVLKHEILSAADGRRLAGLEKTFAVPDWEGVELHGGTVRSNETWRAGIVHVVYETVYVPALCTLMIEPGAIVKFLTGTGITIESGGGALFANGVVFTHINDDTVGGDTLNDGAASPPVMDAYTFRGNLTIGEESELRYKTQTPLSGTVSASRKLTRGSVYRVSGNVTVASGATLTIPAGTVLKFDQGVQMTVNSGGTLFANGTRAAPVVFTSVKDDDHGGDTNGDGDATWPVAGDWTCIKIAGGTARFAHSSILYSSRNQTTGAINMAGGTVVFDSGEIAHGLYDAVGVESGNFFMTNSVIRDCLLAFRHWARDPIVNCVVYDCGRLTQGGGQTFVNCAFSGITETWEAFGFPKSTYRNCCFWNEGGSVLTAEGTQDALDVCGRDGNVWGDPKFRDPGNGDFRILEGSACIDTADSAAAPENDVYGEKRWTWDGSAEGAGAAADIGVAECIPRGAASDVDLVAVSVACDRAKARPGETVFLHWTVANEGGEAVGSGWWDELSLVSASGRVVPLGEKLQGSRVEAGGVVTGTGYFAIPALAEGVYGIRLHANCRRDVAEGTRTGNNLFVADAALALEVETADAAEGAAGMLGEKATMFRKFELGAGSGAQLCRVTAPAGTVLRYGLGAAPSAGVSGGEVAVDASGFAVFAVPEGTEAVYVALEAGGTAGPFDVVFEDGSMSISSVSPQTVPRSGQVTLRVAGAGFAEGCALSLTCGGTTVRPLQLVRTGAEELFATVDCAVLAAAGTKWNVRAEAGDASATLPNAVGVGSAAGAGKLRASLVVPATVRKGYPQPCRVVYANDGNADLPAPLLQVTADNGGLVEHADGHGTGERIQFVGAGGSSVAGVLRPGEERWVAFRFRAGTGSSVYLRTSEGQTWYEAPWTSAAEMLADFSAAATRIGLRGQDPTDWELVRNLAAMVKRGEPASVIYGRVVDEEGMGVEGVSLSLVDTNSLAAASSATDATGRFISPALAPGEYAISFFAGTTIDWPGPVAVDGAMDTGLGVVPVPNALSGVVRFVGAIPEGTVVRAAALDDATVAQAQWLDATTAAFRGLPQGWYHVEASGGNAAADAILCVSADAVGEIELEMRPSGTISGTIANLENPLELGIMVVGRNGTVRVAYADANGAFAVSGLPPGAYSVQLVGNGADAYEATDEIVLAAGGSETVAFEPERPQTAGTLAMSHAATAAATASDDYEPGSNLWFWHYWGIRDDLKEAIGRGRTALDSTGVYDPWMCECVHNRAKYDADIAVRNKLDRVVVWMEALEARADRGYFAPVWKNGLEAIANTVRAAKEFQIMFFSAFDPATKTELMGYVDKAAAVATYFEELDYGAGDYAGQTAAFLKDQFIPDVRKIAENYDKLCSRGIAGVLSALSDSCATGRFDPFTDYIDSLTDLFEEVGKIAELAEKGAGLGAYLAPEHAAHLAVLKAMAEGYQSVAAYLQPAISYLKAVADLLRTQQAFDDGYAGWMDDRRRMEVALARFEPAYADFERKSQDFNNYHNPCPGDELDIPLFDDWVDRAVPDVPQSIDPNEVVGPAGVGNAETERFVEPGEWLDYTIYFENATNATAAAVQVRVTETLSEYLDWDTLELGEVVFANRTDLGLAGHASGTSECEVPDGGYSVRTSFSLHNGIATWHLRMVDPAGDEDGWPTDPYAGFLPPNDEDHNGEGHVSYRIRVRDDAPKNVRVAASADIVFDWNEAIATDPSWWNRVGHLPVSISFDRNCDDTVVGMPRNGDYACDAPPFGSPVREGWIFEGWSDAEGVPRNCGADLPYGTASLALAAQWREEVATRFATIAVEGGVAVTGFAEGQACPADLVIPSSLEVGGRRLKVVGVADDAFAGQRALATLSVAEGVRWIGARAFRNCTQLARVSLPSTLERIGEGAFYGCHLLADAELAAALPPEVGADAFRGVAASGTLAVPEGAEEAYGAWVGSLVGSAWTLSAFRPGESGTPSGMEWMFWADEALLAYFDGADEVRWAITTAPDGADGRLALVRASGEGELPLPESVEDENGRIWRITAIGTNDAGGEGVFEALDATDATIPESVERIAPYAFANCAGLTNVAFAGAAPALHELGDGAFFACTALRSVNLESARRLERLGSEDAPLGTFESCWRLEAATLPPEIGGIGAYAFQDCSRLRAVRFADGGGAGVEWIGERAFYNCDLLAEIDTAAMVSLSRVGAAAFGGDTAATAPKISRVTLHRAVASLGDCAFLNAGMLSDIACFAPVPPERGKDAFRGVAPSGILRTREESAEDYAADNASGWIGAGGDKLPAWNGATGWQVEGATAEDELRERNGQLDDATFAALLAEAAEWGFTADELCGVVAPAGRMRPRVRILSWEGTDAPLFAVAVENGIDETPSAALARVGSLGGYRFAAWTLEDLNGDEREVPCTAEPGEDGTVSVHVEPAAGDPADPEAPSPARGFWRVGMTTRE